MIEFRTTTSGREIGEALARDHEELAYCLLELSDEKRDEIVNGLDEALYGSDRVKVADFLIGIGVCLKGPEVAA